MSDKVDVTEIVFLHEFQQVVFHGRKVKNVAVRGLTVIPQIGNKHTVTPGNAPAKGHPVVGKTE